MTERREVVRSEAGRVIGWVANSRFILRRARSRHWLRLAGGWAIDRASLERAALLGARLVEIADVESGKIYRTPLGTLLAKGEPVDLGFGQQLALPARYWHVEHPAVTQLALFSE